MRRLGDDFLDDHPRFTLALLLVLTLLTVFALAMTFRWSRDREAYLAQAQRIAAIRPDMSLAYAQAFVALGWLAYVGFLLLFSMMLWVDLFHGTTGRSGSCGPQLHAGCAGLVLPYFFWPRWMMLKHARSDLSRFQQCRQRRQAGTDRGACVPRMLRLR